MGLWIFGCFSPDQSVDEELAFQNIQQAANCSQPKDQQDGSKHAPQRKESTSSSSLPRLINSRAHVPSSIDEGHSSSKCSAPIVLLSSNPHLLKHVTSPSRDSTEPTAAKAAASSGQHAAERNSGSSGHGSKASGKQAAGNVDRSPSMDKKRSSDFMNKVMKQLEDAERKKHIIMEEERHKASWRERRKELEEQRQRQLASGELAGRDSNTIGRRLSTQTSAGHAARDEAGVSSSPRPLSCDIIQALHAKQPARPSPLHPGGRKPLPAMHHLHDQPVYSVPENIVLAQPPQRAGTNESIGQSL